jgi:hypothetical protein
VITKKRIGLFSIVAILMIASTLFAGMSIQSQAQVTSLKSQIAAMQLQLKTLELQASQGNTTASTMLNDWIGTITAVECNAQGQVIQTSYGVNKDPLTTYGSMYLLNMAIFTNITTLCTYMTLSNDTSIPVTATELTTLITNDGLSVTGALTPITYQYCTTASGLSRCVVFNNTFTDSSANQNVVQTVGMCANSAGTSALVCAGEFTPSVNLAPTDTLNIQYNITMPCG